MDKIINIPSRVIEGADASATDLIRTLGVGKLGRSPIPVPMPKSTIQFNETHYIVPVALAKSSSPDDLFYIPTDPRVAVGGGNVIASREIADGDIRGTVKELWAHNDWSVSISGVLMSDERNTVKEYQKKLVELCEAKEDLVVVCELLNETFGITRLAVTSLRFDATDGEDNQVFTINTVSDESYNLEVEG